MIIYFHLMESHRISISFRLACDMLKHLLADLIQQNGIISINWHYFFYSDKKNKSIRIDDKIDECDNFECR